MLRKRLFLFTFSFFVLAFTAVALSLRADRAFAQTATPPNFKVAFIADSGAGSNFQRVLDLIKSEGAQMVIHEGDFSYDGTSTWTNRINSTLGSSFPYLGSAGNHDRGKWGDIRSGCSASTWAGIFRCRLEKMGVTPELTSHNQLYAVTYKGLRIVFVNENGGSTGANWINQKLGGDNSIWKICSWHKNQKAMQIGGKGDSMGWEVYENCRKQGAIIATGHEHSYERTKTLTSTQNQTVDSSCSDRNNLCVAPGKTFVFVAGTGGQGLRNQDRCLPTSYPYGCKGEWASIYSTDQGVKHGALFIEFNIDGNPNRAHGYFKNINGQVIDDFFITKGGSAPPPPPGTSTPTPTKSPTATPTPTKVPTPTPSPPPPSTNAIAHWTFDEGSGLNANDSSGNNNTGTISGATWTSSGRFNSALSFDGTGDEVLVSTNLMSPLRGTISTWAMPTTFEAEPQYIFGHTTTPRYANRLQIYTDDTTGQLDIGVGDNHTAAVGVFDLNVNQWYHIALTWDSGTFKVYVNGNLVHTGSYTGLTTLDPSAVIGNANPGQPPQSWNGTIDEINIFNRELSAGEIAALASGGTGTPTPPTTLPGDIDKDGDVDIFDYNALVSNFGATNCGNVADIDTDCDVDIFDYNLLVGNFGKKG